MDTIAANKRLIGNIVKLFNQYNLWDELKPVSTTKDIFTAIRLWDWKRKVGVISTLITDHKLSEEFLATLQKLLERLYCSPNYELGMESDDKLSALYLGKILRGEDVPANPDDLNEEAERKKNRCTIYNNADHQLYFSYDPATVLKEAIEMMKQREKIKNAAQDAARMILIDPQLTTVKKRHHKKLIKDIERWDTVVKETEAAEKDLISEDWKKAIAVTISTIAENNYKEQKDPQKIASAMVPFGFIEQYDTLEQFYKDIKRAIKSLHYSNDQRGEELKKLMARTDITVTAYPADDTAVRSQSLWKKAKRKQASSYKEETGYYGVNVPITVMKYPIFIVDTITTPDLPDTSDTDPETQSGKPKRGRGRPKKQATS